MTCGRDERRFRPKRADVVARFLREASAAGHIANPHIVETFDASNLESGEPCEPYIVMEMLAAAGSPCRTGSRAWTRRSTCAS